jgi:hypothetical protein
MIGLVQREFVVEAPMVSACQIRVKVSAGWRLGAILALAIFMSGCVLSVEPVISESVATFDPRLLGSWEENSGSDRAVVSRAAENEYAIEYTSDGKVSRFQARLGRLGGRTVLDVWPAPRDSDLPQPYADLMVVGHLLLALDVGTDEIRAGDT